MTRGPGRQPEHAPPGEPPPADSACRTDRGSRSGGWIVGALAAVIAAGLAARSTATLLPPFAVGDDGAYYLVQVRAILRGGTLAIPDFPLLFYLQASLARLLALVMTQRDAIIAAVRLTDTCGPLALAVPVALFARAFTRPGDRPARGALAVALVGLVAVASGHSLITAGGMIKNAAALVCSFFFAFASHRWLRDGRRGALASGAIWFVLASLTHMGGVTLCSALAACLLAAGLATPALRPRVWQPALVLLACFITCLAVVHTLDPDRARRLLHAIVAPSWLVADAADARQLRVSPASAIVTNLASAEAWLGNALGLLGAITLWRHRAGMDAPTRALLVASTVVSFAFSSPLLRPEVLQRLALLAYVPGMIPLVYLVCRDGGGAAVVAPLTLAVMLQGALAVKTLRLTALVPAAHAELARFASAVPAGRVIVITRPLLRWWVAWTMDTRFSTRIGPALAARGAYDAVLIVDEVRGGAFGAAPAPAEIGALAAGVKDASPLRAEDVRTLAEGEYLRLSEIVKPPP